MSKTSRNPFPGLRPFQKDESQFFFGREAHVREVLRKLDVFRFVSIVGSSGSGKSSLVRAGVLHRLEQATDHTWKICIIHPGKNPIEELGESLYEADLYKDQDGKKEKNLEEYIAILKKSRLGIVQLVRPLLSQGERLLIMVDQFEELNRFHIPGNDGGDDDNIAAQFVDLLLGATNQKEVPIYVMMTIRSDFLGDCERYIGLAEAINDGQFLIPRMNRAELESCITGPVHLVNGKISPQLVHKLLGEVTTSPDQLPVLQHALMRTWKVWENENNTAKPIGVEEFRKTGGMEMALSNHAEEAYAELITDKRRKLAEAIFKIITIKGPDNRGIRRPTPIEKIMRITQSNFEEVKEIADIFRRPDNGFIMPSSSVQLSEQSVLDISHESLMRVWDRLEVWVEEEAESAKIYNRICDSALLYDKNKAGLWRDPDLQIAVDWRSKNKPNKDWANQYNSNFDLAIRFIDASIQDKKYVLAESRNRKKFIQIGVMASLAALCILTVWAFFERNHSAKSEKIALAEKQDAEQKTIEALNEKELAEKAKNQSLEASRKALDAKAFAELQKSIADSQREIAQRQSIKAKQQGDLARQQEAIAEQQANNAKEQKQMADAEKEKAITAQQAADRLRLISKSQNVAFKSLQVKTDPQLAALLSNEAYILMKDNDGNVQDPQLYTALYQGLKNFGQGAYPATADLPAEAVDINASANGQLWVILANGILIHYNAGDNKPSSPVRLGETAVNTAYLSKDCRNAVTTYDDNTLRIWTTVSGSGSAPLQGHSGLVRAASFSNDGNTVLTGGRDSTVIIWNKGNLQQQIKFSSRIRQVEWIDNNQFLAGCEDGIVYRYTIADGKSAILVNNSPARIQCIARSNHGNYMVVSSSNGLMNIFSSQGQLLKTISEGHSIDFISVNDDLGLLAEATSNRIIRIYDLSDLSQKPLEINDINKTIKGIALYGQGSLSVACSDNTIRSYSVRSSVLQGLVSGKITRSLTEDEWNLYIGKDVPYRKM